MKRIIITIRGFSGLSSKEEVKAAIATMEPKICNNVPDDVCSLSHDGGDTKLLFNFTSLFRDDFPP